MNHREMSKLAPSRPHHDGNPMQERAPRRPRRGPLWLAALLIAAVVFGPGCSKTEKEAPAPAATKEAAGAVKSAGTSSDESGTAKPPAPPTQAAEAAPANKDTDPPKAADSDVAPPAPKPEAITLWHPYEGAEAAALNEAVQIYAAKREEREDGKPLLPIRVEALAYADLADRFATAAATEDGPDAVIFAHNYLGAWSELGLVEAFAQQVPADVLGDTPPAAIMAATYEGKLRGLPLSLKPLALYCRTDLVADPIATLADLERLGKALSERTPAVRALAFEGTALYFHSPFLHGAGGSVLDESGRVELDSAPHVKALARVAELAESGVIDAKANDAEATRQFNAGSAACVISGPWFRDGIAAGVSYRVQSLPDYEAGHPMRGYLAVEVGAVNTKSKHQNEAFALLSELSGVPASTQRATKGKQLVANRRALAAASGEHHLKDLWAAANASVAIPNDPLMMGLWAIYDDALQAVLAGGAAPKDALAEAQRQAVRLVVESNR